MPFMILALVAAAGIALFLWHTRIPALPVQAGDWGTPSRDDPRIAVAAMLVAVASEDGPLTLIEEDHIVSLLRTTIGLTPDIAQTCLIGGKNLARQHGGDLTSRLHALRPAVAKHCSPKEKDEIIVMLRAVAGKSSDRLFSVRDAIGRLATSLADV